MRLTVTPGETVVDSMALHNVGSTTANVKIYWQDFTYLPPFTGKKDFSQPGTSPYSMASWITFSPQIVTLPPQSKRDIDFTIKVPEDAKGGHYGVLFFEQGGAVGTKNTGVNIVTRLGSLFFVETVNRDKTSTIDNIKIEEQAVKGTFTNKGDVFLFPRGIFYLTDQEGIAIERGEIEKIYLTPGNTADFTIKVNDQLAVGNYTMVLTFDLDDGDSVIKEIDFSKSDSGQLNMIAVRD
ncbi:MAG: hypothetical protein KBD53_04210 [Candidatus Omnitrophica bacterium]|nr:hypothetical protein [Candidatus Omnitrophota bacterium]